jgi:hypothetical protein
MPPSEVPFQDELKPFFLLGGFNAAELWPTINFCLVAWALLIFLPRWKWTPTLTLIPPIYHAILYVGSLFSLLLTASEEDGGMPDFSTFEGVVTLFKDPNGVFVGWVHYIVFDVLVGRMIVLESAQRGASIPFHIVAIIPCLTFTFLLGPSGWLLYMILRGIFLPEEKVTQSKTKLKAKIF